MIEERSSRLVQSIGSNLLNGVRTVKVDQEVTNSLWFSRHQILHIDQVLSQSFKVGKKSFLTLIGPNVINSFTKRFVHLEGYSDSLLFLSRPSQVSVR